VRTLRAIRGLGSGPGGLHEIVFSLHRRDIRRVQSMFGKSNEKTTGTVRQAASAAPAQSAATEAGTAGASATEASGARGRPAPTFRYIDRPELPETFADSVTGLFFDGQCLRVEFSVSRVDEIKPNSPITGRRYPACRIVLPPQAAVELINKMQQIGAALANAGVVKQQAAPAPAQK
jgi:hypothetical protein